MNLGATSMHITLRFSGVVKSSPHDLGAHGFDSYLLFPSFFLPIFYYFSLPYFLLLSHTVNSPHTDPDYLFLSLHFFFELCHGVSMGFG